jgi:hypothetical protein
MQQNPSSVSSSGLPTQIHQGISEVTARSHSCDKYLCHVRPSVCLSVGMFQHLSHWTYLRPNDISDFYKNLSRNSKFG